MINDKYLQVIAHFYRGEMNRLTVYRSRLDNTFQYSILFTSVLLIYYLENKKNDLFPLYIIFFNILFCFIESRRYRYFMISQNRINLMEKGFFSDQVLNNNNNIDWKNELNDCFINVKFTHSLIYSFIIRYFRNYIWLIDSILILWYFVVLKNIFLYCILGVILVQHLLSLFIKNEPDI
jgi:uncharacterized membrane protein